MTVYVAVSTRGNAVRVFSEEDLAQKYVFDACAVMGAGAAIVSTQEILTEYETASQGKIDAIKLILGLAESLR